MVRAATRLVPVELVWMQARPVVVLRRLPPRDRRDPFWEDTLLNVEGPPLLWPLDRAPDADSVSRPAGFLFHMLRCGSTLACRLLGEFPGVVALSEPMIFQSLLTGPGGTEQRSVWLRRLMALHSAGLCGAGQSLVVKWSSVSGCYIREIQAAFPEVPAVFVHRDPVEVLVSCTEGPPQSARLITPECFPPHLRPGAAADIRTMPLAELIARFHGSCCFHAAAAGPIRRLEYPTLPEVVWSGLAAHFRLPVPEGAAADALRDLSRVDAKDPAAVRPFTPDSGRKQARASSELRGLAQRFVRPELNRLIVRHPAL